jgi:predicted deacetylase
LEIFYKLNRVLKYLFVPPAWKLNENSIEVLKKMGFDLTEIHGRLLLLSYNTCKKIKVPKVFNWDLTGYSEKML